MRFALALLAALLFVLHLSNPTTAQITSKYSSLSTKACRELKVADDEGTEYQGECPGVAGYKLRLLEGDLRQSVDVITPLKKTHPLAFWNIFGGFSFVGDQAEWRMKGRMPIALIVRLNVSEDPENTDRRTSYLVVTKITKDEICVTDLLKPTRSHNFEARRAADSSANRPCFKRDSP
jgi:hypothetical protein